VYYSIYHNNNNNHTQTLQVTYQQYNYNNKSMLLSRVRHHLSRSVRRLDQSSQRLASTLVLSEPLHNGSTPGQTQSTVTAAQAFGQDVELLVVGPTPPTEIPDGCSKVHFVLAKDKLAETVALACHKVALQQDANVLLGTSTKFGSTVIPRAAALMDVSPITDILEIQDESESTHTQKK